MPCCNEPKIEVLSKGIQVTENYVQNDDVSIQFFAYTAIESMKFDYIRDDRSGVITMCIANAKSPYAYRYCDGGKARELYQSIMAAWNQ
jgi:hypothetical protein